MGPVRRLSDRYQSSIGKSSAGTVNASSVPDCAEVMCVNTAMRAALKACAAASSAQAVWQSRRR